MTDHRMARDLQTNSRFESMRDEPRSFVSVGAHRDFLKGVQITLTLTALAIMLWIAGIILITGETLYSSIGYQWFLHHGPGTDRGWGEVFAVSAVVGSLGLWRRTKAWRFLSGTVLAMGHVTFAYGIWATNSISTGAGTYSIVAGLSIVALLIAIHDP